MKHIALLLLLLTSWSYALNAQELNKHVYSEDAGEEILLGPGDRAGLEEEPFRAWFDPAYASYHPDTVLLGKIRCPRLEEMIVTVVLGTWCPDSRREVPRFFKVADMLDIPGDHIRVVYVDLHKKAPGIRTDSLLIERVPTFIFELDGLEVGRIVEEPRGSFEKEIGRICRKVEEEGL